MARPSSDEALREAIGALHRVRSVERPADEPGLWEIWHQGHRGADLLSFVDGDGRLTRQELTLLGDYLCWSTREGLSTGIVVPRARGDTSEVRLDPGPSQERVARALRALVGYAGQDRYLLHLRQVVEAARRGAYLEETPVVTAVRTPPPLEAVGRPPRLGLRAALGLCLALLVVLSVGGWLVFRGSPTPVAARLTAP